MKTQKTLALIAFVLIASMAITAISAPFAKAQTSGQMKSFAYLIVEPNPVGVGQTTYVAMMVDVPLPGSSEANDIRRHNYKLTITAPDGKVTTKTWAVVADTTGVQSTAFTPDQVGNYTFFFEYPNQNYTWTTGTYLVNTAYTGVIFLGCNATATLTVQEDPVPYTANSPLPTEYWTRPIYGEDSNWYVVGSHWLGSGSSYTAASSNYFGSFQQGGMNLWQQGGTGPDSPHIVWTTPLEDGGVVGGINTGIEGATFYSGGSYEGRFQNALIVNGRLYYKAPLSDQVSVTATGGGAYICRDLRTGEIIWTNDNINPTFGELYCYESPNQHGVIPNGYLWQAVTPSGSVTNQTWIAWDALTGKWLFNITDVPVTSATTTPNMSSAIAYTNQGEIVKYILSYNRTAKTGWLALWNWTCAQGVPPTTTGTGGVQAGMNGTGTNFLQFRPVGKVINASTAYSWNVTITADLTGTLSSQVPTIQYVLPGDILLGTTPSLAPGVLSLRGTVDPYQVWTLSLAEDNKGALLWKKSYNAPSGNMTLNLGPIDPVNRVWTTTTAEDMQYQGYSLANGNKLWETDMKVRPMQFFSSGSGAGQRCVTAYGNLYTQGFGGEIFCIDTNTGKVVWKYNNTSGGVDTSWGLIPTFIGVIADGKVYAFNNEHSPNSPLYKGYSIYCINATTGEEIYKMLSWSGQTGGQGLSTQILADGTLVYYNYYDNQLYAIAKGPSQTTVTAGPKVTELGQKVLVEGTVIDISAGTKQTEQAARFPSGVPAVSDASQAAWMEYVYMDQPRPTDATGVPVTVSVVDPNGNYYVVGTATSDSNGAFKVVFTPEVPGVYTVMANFAGSASYYGSHATTAVYVDEAHATATPQATKEPTAADLYFVPAIAGLFVLVIIVLALLVVLMMKKRP
ncbi:MAG: PQQ-binding-like beta-propeller repeat protein [Candidatus Bathyarchaeota archaeon]|nr:PQQ-binding-like beta-propeller repeat protein [Candidatus Bathyarchaeota archaeon]